MWQPSMTPDEADLDLNATLSALLGLVGGRVSVLLADPDGKPVIVARLEGTLRRSADVSVLDRADAEAQFFYVTDEPSDDRLIGFMLHAGSFRGGQTEEGRVRFLQGGVLVDVRAEG